MLQNPDRMDGKDRLNVCAPGTPLSVTAVHVNSLCRHKRASCHSWHFRAHTTTLLNNSPD